MEVLRMRIAQISPLYESVPPQLYGGTERIVAYLTEELVREGHEVTLFASADSKTSAALVPCAARALRLDPDVQDSLPYHIVMLDEVRRHADEFDVLHFHVDLLHFPLVRAFADSTLTTLHGRLDLPDLTPFYRAYPDVPLASISRSQARAQPDGNWVECVPHGLPSNLLTPAESPRLDYLAFLGRVSPEKGPDRAIEIAQRTGHRLRMAAKVDRNDRKYWKETVKPMIDAHEDIEFIGEITEADKGDFLGHASALLFPIDWPEPFGLVMIEAMACGTPVIAYDRGSVREIVEDGVTGRIVTSLDEAVAAVQEVERFDRARIRARFEERFTAERMARDYVRVYQSLPGVQRSLARRARMAGTSPRLVGG
jgi:glycosyltransferase involved in cell wall biosynthesis